MKKKIEQVHFQITRNCNLRCEFCGQWGKEGFFRDASGESMTYDDWGKVIFELEDIGKKYGNLPTVTVWGGEPLVALDFDKIMKFLKDKSFPTEIITNGVLIEKHRDSILKYVDKLYVSIDGTREVHDSVRGEGVFDKVFENLSSLKHKNLTVMSVITEKLIEILPEFLNEISKLDVKELLLQDMIGLSDEKINSYREWMMRDFKIDAQDIKSWKNNGKIDFSEELEESLKRIDLSRFKFNLVHKKHTNKGICLSPFRHPHIAWNGNVHYCTDFYDFSAGNVKNEKLIDVFNNEKSEKFRESIQKNLCSACYACSWRIND